MPEKRKPAIRNYPKHFRSDASELNYINDQVEKALYLNQDPTSAQAYLPRLDELLSKRDWEDGSIMLQAFRALRNEIVGDLESAIPHRELEVEYIEHETQQQNA